MMKISYRKCRRKDLIPATRLMRSAMQKLRNDTGKEFKPMRIMRRPSPMILGFLKRDGDTMYCAWKGKKLVGFAGAYVNGKQWYLSWLFVHPNVQDKGIGHKLLEKVWRDKKGMTHSLCTFAFNPQAIGLYSKFGMAPLCDLPWMKANPRKIKKLESTGLKIIDTPTAGDFRWINHLEAKIRGYSHPQHWRIWSKQEPFKVYIFRKRGKRVGYCMIVRKNFIAPVGVTSEKYMIDAVTEAIRLTNPEKNEKISLWVPSLNIPLYKYLIDIGFRVDELEIFMSDSPYIDWSRYVPATLAIV
jgi:ribosomal protein S18 acetylase RimI-like enzyme